jgi:hypothetical protein
MAINRQVSFEVEGTPDEVLESMVRALSDMRCYRFNRDDMTVTARTQLSWRSIGEFMSVQLSEARAGRTRVDAASRSTLGTVLFDWGKNNANLKRFEAIFRARLAMQVKAE